MLYRPWVIGTNISSYLDELVSRDLKGQELYIDWDKNPKSRVILKIGNEILKETSWSTARQMLNVYRILEIISVDPTCKKNIKNWVRVNNKINFKTFERGEFYERIAKALIGQFTSWTMNQKDYFNNLEISHRRFLFSLAATFICIDKPSLSNMIDTIMEEGASFKKFKIYYENLAKNIRETSQSHYRHIVDLVSKILIPQEVQEVKSHAYELVQDSESNQEDIMITNKAPEIIYGDNYTFGSFIDEFILTKSNMLKIPIYQRKYCWSPAQATRLIDDIDAINRAGKEKYHSLGVFVTSRQSLNGKITEAIFKIVDGQQRVSTLFLTLIALFLICERKGYIIDREVKKILTRNILANSFVRIKGNDDYDIFLDLFNLDFHTKRKEFKNHLIYKVYEAIYTKLLTLIKDRQSAREFWSKLLNQTIFLLVRDESASEYDLFKRLNTGMVPLNVMELIKNKILNRFQLIVDQDEKRYQEIFEEKIMSYFRNKDGVISKQSTKRFIFVLSRYHNLFDNASSEYDLYNSIIEDIYFQKLADISNESVIDESTNNKLTKSLLLNLINIMHADIKLFFDIWELSSFGQNTNRFHSFADYLFTLHKDIYAPLLMKILHNFCPSKWPDVNRIRRLLHVIETYEIRFQVVDFRGQSLGDVINDNITTKIEPEQVSPKKLFTLFKDLKNNAMPDIDTFVKVFEQHKFSNELANKVMLRIENFLHFGGINLEDSKCNVWLIGHKSGKISREHILPKNFDNWKNDLINHYEKGNWRDSIESCIDLIGNSIILTTNKNSKVSNAKWSKKYGEYIKTQETSKLNLVSGFKKEYVTLEKLDGEKPFNLKLIKERSKKLAQLAGIIWGERNEIK